MLTYIVQLHFQKARLKAIKGDPLAIVPVLIQKSDLE